MKEIPKSNYPFLAISTGMLVLAIGVLFGYYA